MLAIRPVRMNVFVKPNEQSQVYLSYAMARKGRIYPTFSLSQMSNDELAYSLPWREKVHANEYLSRQDSDLSPCPFVSSVEDFLSTEHTESTEHTV